MNLLLKNEIYFCNFIFFKIERIFKDWNWFEFFIWVKAVLLVKVDIYGNTNGITPWCSDQTKYWYRSECKRSSKLIIKSVWLSLYREVYGENPFNKVPQYMCIYSSRILSAQCFWINPESRAERTWTYSRQISSRRRTGIRTNRTPNTNSSFIPARKDKFYAYLTENPLFEKYLEDYGRLGDLANALKNAS